MVRKKRYQMKYHIRSFLPAFAIIRISFLNRLLRFNSGREYQPRASCPVPAGLLLMAH